ncbi:hypothetical protein OEZ85_009818 [Tetradesmus obliquus]|uniref:ABC transporter domain-containing protein n=1 Tax=Tetradesmus obliquus TaxID=3088 RepID=A0ABY8UCH8_TETOB|nr:hypothetical protein OEZ85_009818 [Tetradesmus obliquus]
MAEGQAACTRQQQANAGGSSSSSSSSSSKQMFAAFCAVLYKNGVLQLRGRFGSAWLGALLQIMLPAAVLAVMCIYKHYLPPVHHSQLQQDAYDIDTKWWAGAVPYTGPALQRSSSARILLVPHTAEVAALAARLAKAVSCPDDAYKRLCSPARPSNFPCMFGINKAPPECQEQDLAVDRALLGGLQSDSSMPAGLKVKVKPFPWPAMAEDVGAAAASLLVNLLMLCAFLLPTCGVVAVMVREKELRLREFMAILGLPEPAYWASWALTHFTSLAASSMLCALLGRAIFPLSSWGLLLAFYLLLSAALPFSYFISTWFSSSRVAGMATLLIYVLAALPGLLLPHTLPFGTTATFIAACLLPPSAAALFVTSLMKWERRMQGLSLQTLWLPATQSSSFSAGSALVMLAVDALLFAALTWWADKVMPKTYGQVQPPWFFLLPSYWTGRSRDTRSADAATNQTDCDTSTAGAASGQQQQHTNGLSNGLSKNVPAYIEVVGLGKTYVGPDGSSRVAVAGLSMQLGAGRVAALLGRNGAGKSTVMHMLTGLLQPSTGTAYIAGANIRTNTAAVRRSLGIVPQVDILWPSLTVREHLQLYAVTKGVAWSEAAAAAEAAAAEVGLSEKLPSLAEELSGGQRRKLSVAVAFLGNPAVVLLDEPTSGMDPASRAATWQVIRSRRALCVIVLTTHSMAEAEALADDIHVLHEGHLIASGSSTSLTAQYGWGYTLRILLERHPCSQFVDSDGAATTGSRQPPALLQEQQRTKAAAAERDMAAAAAGLVDLVQRRIPEAELLSAAGAELSFRMPGDASEAAAGLLDARAAAQAELGVASYTFSTTTLQEVVLALTDQAAASPGGSGTPAAAAAGWELFWLQSKSLWRKRLLCARRDRLATLLQLLLPVLLVFMGLAACRIEMWGRQQPPLLMSRQRCMQGRPTLLAASSAVMEQQAQRLQQFMDAYPRSDITWMQQHHLYQPSAADSSPKHTLEQQLLQQWDDVTPTYDAVFVHHLPTAEELLTSLSPSVLEITLLANQSAIAAIPAALNQATSALLRMMLAAKEAAGIKQLVAGDAQEGGSCSSDDAADSEISSASDMSSGHACGATGDTQQQYPTATAAAEPATGAPAGEYFEAAAVPSCCSISASSQPLPLIPGETFFKLSQELTALGFVLCASIALSLLGASFAPFLVRERENNSKYLQTLSGATPAATWLSNFAWDAGIYGIAAAAMLALLAAHTLHVPQLDGPRAAALAAVLLAYGPASICLTYLAQQAFGDEMVALQVLSAAYLVTGFLGVVVTTMLQLLGMFRYQPRLYVISEYLKVVLRIASPSYCFAQAQLDIIMTYADPGSSTPYTLPLQETNPLSFDILGIALLHLAGQAFVFGAAAVLLDTGLLQWLWRSFTIATKRKHTARQSADTITSSSTAPADRAHGVGAGKDSCATSERGKAADSTAAACGGSSQQAMVVFDNVSKSYAKGPASRDRVPALSQLSQRIYAGECFALLGANGAGKTTAIKILTGEIQPDAGDAFVAGYSVTQQLAAAQHCIGYSPQFEALTPGLSGQELLLLYAALRGVKCEQQAAQMAQQLLQALGLEALADVPCGTYSGGNKARLSVAVALVAQPQLVVLDEPSTGMDAAARHALWKVLQAHVLSCGRTVLLSTHAMEEAEALADRRRSSRVIGVVRSKVSAKMRESFGPELAHGTDVEAFLRSLEAANPSKPADLLIALSRLSGVGWNPKTEPAASFLQRIVKLHGDFRMPLPHLLEELERVFTYFGSDPMVMILKQQLQNQATTAVQKGNDAAVCFNMLQAICRSHDAQTGQLKPPVQKPQQQLQAAPRQQQQQQQQQQPPPQQCSYMGAAGGALGGARQQGGREQQQGGRGRGQQQRGGRGGAFDLDQRQWHQQQPGLDFGPPGAFMGAMRVQPPGSKSIFLARAGIGKSAISNSTFGDYLACAPHVDRPGTRRTAIKPRGAEAVVPGVDDQPAGAGAPADQPAVGASADPLSRLKHSVMTAPIVMQLRQVMQLAGSADADPMREAFKQLGIAFDPQVFPGLVLGAVMCDFFGDNGGSSAAGRPARVSSSSSSSIISSSSAADLPALGDPDSCSDSYDEAGPKTISTGGGSSLPQGLFIETGTMRPAAAFSCSSAGVQGRRNSSNSSAAAQPYKQALTAEAVDLSVAEQMRVGGDIAGASVEFVVDSGCGHSVVSLAQAQDLVSVLGKLGSSCALISLDDPLCVGMFAGPIQVPATHVLRSVPVGLPATHVLRSVPVGLGLGVYPQHFLVMEGANFPITLGLDFCNTYGANIFSRSWHNRQVGAELQLPVPRQHARRGQAYPQPPWYVPQHLRASWIFTARIAGHYVVHRHRCYGKRVPLESLLAADR